MGSAVLEFYAQKEMYGMRIKNMGVPDYLVEHGSVADQRMEVGLSVESIINQVKVMLPLQRQRA